MSKEMTLELFDPRNDFVFKNIFGNEKYLDILKDFLEAILELPKGKEIVSVELKNPNNDKQSKEGKYSIFDIKVRINGNAYINVEIQNVRDENIVERVIYYNGILSSGQLLEGEGYGMLSKSITIVVADFLALPNSKKIHSVYTPMEKDELTELTNSSGEGLIEIHFIELSKFRKYIKGKNIMEIVRENNLYKWLVFILDPSNEVIEMISKSDKVVNRATKALRELSSDDEARMKYMDREKARLDKISALFSAEKKGERKGEMREKIKIAKAMIKEGFSVENIMKLTELKREEIEELPKK